MKRALLVLVLTTACRPVVGPTPTPHLTPDVTEGTRARECKAWAGEDAKDPDKNEGCTK